MSYLHSPRPFKNPNYTKNINRRTKNLKTVLTQERERERAERERRRQEKDERMEVDGGAPANNSFDEEEEMPTCKIYTPFEFRNNLQNTIVQTLPSKPLPQYYLLSTYAMLLVSK